MLELLRGEFWAEVCAADRKAGVERVEVKPWGQMRPKKEKV